MRWLIHVPVVHTVQDLGSHLEKAKAEYLKEFGLRQWNKHVRDTGNLWKMIRDEVLALSVDFARLKVFQDGLPVCGRKMEIVRKLAADGNPNHRLLADLADRGATILGTEEPDLLLREKKNLETLPGTRGPVANELLRLRDAFVAKRIAAMVGDGETGLLFMGALHQVEKILPPDFEVKKLTDERNHQR